MAEFLGIDQTWIIVALGAGLVGFAVAVAAVSLTGTRTLLPSSQVISTGDIGWVAGTIAAIGLGWLSDQGAVVMGLIGMVVLGLGLAQLRARRSLILAVGEKHDHGTWLR